MLASSMPEGGGVTDQPGPQGPSRNRAPLWKRRRTWLVAGGSVVGVFVLLVIIGLIVGPQPTKTTAAAGSTRTTAADPGCGALPVPPRRTNDRLTAQQHDDLDTVNTLRRRYMKEASRAHPGAG